MDIDPRTFRSSLRALSRALGLPTKFSSEEARTYRRLLAGEVDIGTVGLDPRTSLVVAIWRVMFRPEGLTIFVTPTEAYGRAQIQYAETMILKNQDVARRVWVGANHVGLASPNASTVCCLHGRPGEVLAEDKMRALKVAAIDDVLVIIPDLDRISTDHIKTAVKLADEYGFSLLVNTPKK
jgi:hypothetical protein